MNPAANSSALIPAETAKTGTGRSPASFFEAIQEKPIVSAAASQKSIFIIGRPAMNSDEGTMKQAVQSVRSVSPVTRLMEPNRFCIMPLPISEKYLFMETPSPA
ncbi:hypothetical protein LJK87_30145 [Paenibacillus sp. P25]|nr:hypothetical protein LJK87_30145 [Paenibacillus sp. P25]